MAKKTTLADVAKFLQSNNQKGDVSFWGKVAQKMTDGSGNTTGYKVSLDGTTDGAVTCKKMSGANVGDIVFGVIRSTGEAVVINTKGGDKDAASAASVAELASQTATLARQTADSAKSTADAASKTFTTATVSPPYKKGDTWVYSTIRKICVVTRTSGSYVASDWEDIQGDGENNYFWYDSNGAHISLADHSVTNVKNVLVDSGGMYVRNGTTNLSSFGASEINLGANSTSSTVKMCGGELEVSHDSYTNYSLIKSSYGSSASAIGLSCTSFMVCAMLYATNGTNETSVTANPTLNRVETDCDFHSVGNITTASHIQAVSAISGSTITTGVDIDGKSGSVTATGNISGYLTSKYTTAYANPAGRGSNGNIGDYSGSSRRFKENIKSLSDEQKRNIKKLYDIEVKSWNYKDWYIDEEEDIYQKTIFGIIAEDVMGVMPEIVCTDAEGRVSNYIDRLLMNAMLVLIQDQQAEIESLKQRVDALENE